MLKQDVVELIELLRESRNDSYRVEVKEAARALPSDLDETLSAFGNMPEGGIILLGVAENDGAFDVTGVWNPKAAQAALGSKARERIQPPLQLGAVDTFVIEDHPVVACVVPPQPQEFKPFRVGTHGPAFTRSSDGDYHLDPREEQFLTNAGDSSSFDRAPVLGASVERDLDPELVEQYLSSQLNSSRRLKNSSRDEQLIRTSIAADEEGHPTVAALYALGTHPQQFLPHLALKLGAKPDPSHNSSLRFIDKAQFTGPVPDLLEMGFAWIQKHLMQSVVFRDGHGYDSPEIPAVAVREILANALVHRDLSPASVGRYSQVTKVPGKLIIENPGGLWGITKRELGKTGPRARNPILYDMCAAVTTSSGTRVIEASATGIPATRQALHDAFLPEPFFNDRVISFQAVLTSSTLLTQEQISWLSTLPGGDVLTVAQRHALVAMKEGHSVTNQQFRKQFPMDSVQARNELQELVSFGLAETRGAGRSTAYVLKATGRGASSAAPHRRYVSAEQKQELVLNALRDSVVPLDRKELQEITGLSLGQLKPTLSALVDEGAISMVESKARTKHQRYMIAEG